MFRKSYLAPASFLLAAIFIFSCQEEDQDTLRIAAAANLQFAIQELSDTFRQKEPIPIDIITSSSGKLTAQIEQGAPFDIFISADLKYPTNLYKKGYSKHPPGVYCFGKLILWSMDKNIELSPEDLMRPEFKRIAIANPKTAPYGVAAISFLKRSKLYDTLEPRLVYGENISQTSQFIQSGAADAGFIAKSIISAGPAKGAGQWMDLPIDQYEPIAQGALLLNGRPKMHGKAGKFYNFLFSEEAGRILIKHGYNSSNTNEPVAR